MKLGLFGINMGSLGNHPERAVEVARAAEAAGWESVWTGEHFALADPPVQQSPASPDTAILEPFVSLANVAAHTNTVLLGTGVTVLPLYQPLALAKQVTSLDRISGGRVLLGVGAGYYEPEFAAFGIPLESRASTVDEMIPAARAVVAPDTDLRVPGADNRGPAGRTTTGPADWAAHPHRGTQPCSISPGRHSRRGLVRLGTARNVSS